jgi:hypothetical protein
MPRYTHFWSLNDKVPDRLAWPRIVRDVQVVLEAFEHLVKANHYTTNQRYNTQTIEFDSTEPTDHSRFMIKLGRATFQYCRTLRTEYDLPVAATLLVVKRHAPQWIKLTPDGRWADYHAAREVLRDLLDYQDENFASAKVDFDELIKNSDEEFDMEAYLGALSESLDEPVRSPARHHCHEDGTGAKR